ncbi:DUF6671 family protein [Sulfobacillus sp. hq2]|uniref:DUF6671 family protein n=1 Tax=Sulfobacillus sp. hq2 TaxID=2039167 RepID=UPI000CD0307F|nr:DUF6671 family protein [Sulfobacillus sp. hq2]POB09436.1 hypothetical protein CO251_14450 [Sulfobacillus sp. hq2]
MSDPYEPHPYQGQKAVLATKHQKEIVLGPPLQQAVGLDLYVPENIDTDLLGTFSGEIERHGTPRDVALRKARWGMELTGLSLGLASEGSFGPHPQLLFVPSDHELLAFIDQERGIEIVEQTLSVETNYGHQAAKSVDDLQEFLTQVQFPSHALIVRPHSGFQPDLLFKGISDVPSLRNAVALCSAASADGMAHVETDMRAHVNPMRQRVLNALAAQLGRRLASRCPSCHAPGFGVVDVVKGLPCEQCGLPTQLISEEVFGCAVCTYREQYPRSDGLQVAPAASCSFCNP